MRRILPILTAMVLAPVLTLPAQPTLPQLRSADRIRLAEAFHLFDAVGESVWAGWPEAPFAVLLVTPDREFLVRHPNPTDDFTPIGYDSLLQSEVYVRDRVFQPNLLATFPAVAGVSTIVVGQPEQTGRSSTAWVVTLLHEHFHQLQDSQPDMNAEVAALDLAGDDESGMWMLNYPFPYDSTIVSERFFELTRSALTALGSIDTPDFAARVETYKRSRDRVRDVLSDADFRYLSFQLWKEGVARFIEYKVAEAASDGYEPTPAFAALEDFEPYEQVASDLYNQIGDELEDQTLSEARRGLFYPLGAAEALMLDAVNPDWRDLYFAEKFYLDVYF